MSGNVGNEGWPHFCWARISFGFTCISMSVKQQQLNLSISNIMVSLFRLETFPSPRKIGVFSMEFLFQLEFLDSFY